MTAVKAVGSSESAPLTPAQVRRLRPSEAHRARREQLRTDRPLGFSVDVERCAGTGVSVLTVFLTGAECPFSCAFCDLWQYTLLEATPRGAIPDQLQWLRRELDGEPLDRRPQVLKLYNASNFFEERAVPEADDAAILRAIAELPLAKAARVVVECHPRVLLRRRAQARLERYATELSAIGRRLEVAFGLETVAPGALSRLNKGATLEEFERAMQVAVQGGASVRAFVLYGIPAEPAADLSEEAQRQAQWTLATVEWAKRRGASSASVIPLRPGKGVLDELRTEGRWTPPTLENLLSVAQQALELQSLSPPFDVHLDTWDLEEVASSTADPVEAEALRRRLVQLNLDGCVAPLSSDEPTA